MRTIRVGLAGLGNVGGAVARLFERAVPDFERRLGVRPELAWLCDRHPERKVKALALGKQTQVTKDWRRLLADPDLDIVIELLGGRGDASQLVLGALKAGKRVVTANKKLLAHEWEAVFEAAARAGTRVGIEASVAGAIPILQVLDQGLVGNEIRRVVGILNGTTNYILSRMEKEGMEFGAALKEAQEKGMAERDPTMDLDGTDTAHKVSVVASMLSGSWVPSDSISREGIEAVAQEDLRFARAELGCTIRLLGILEFSGSEPLRLQAGVHPTLVPLEHPLAAVHGGYNAIMVQASAAQDLMFYGLGAGPEPAASAVLADVFAACADILAGRAAPPALRPTRRLELLPAGGVTSAFYLRMKAADRPGVLAKAAGALARRGISIARIHQEQKAGPGGVSVMITTHPVAARELEAAVAGLRRIPGIGKDIVRLRQL